MPTTNTIEGLKRVVGVPGLTLNINNSTIGAGIFTLPAIVSIELGVFGVFSYIFCGIMLTSILLCYAEIVSRVTTAGGSYAYVETAFGDFTRYIVIWVFVSGWGI